MRLLGAKSAATFGCMSMERLGAKYALVGCIYMETFGCMYADLRCMYANFACKSMERLGACLTVGSLPDSR